MPELSTDDGPRKLRAVWLGPKGATLPFEWTYVQWSVVLILTPVAVVVGGLLLLLLGLVTVGHPFWFTWWFAGIYGAPAGVYFGVRVMRGVDFDQPLRYKLATFHEEFGRSMRTAAEKPINWQMPFPVIVELAELPDVQVEETVEESET